MNTRGRRLAESLGPPENVSLVPGNHDVYVRGVTHHLRSRWGAYMRGDDAGRDYEGELEFPSYAAAARWR